MLTNEQIQALKAAAEKATQGEWWSDVIDEEDITTYAVYGPDNRSLLDMLNSTAAEIHEEYDRDYFMQWDETAKRNADFIAKAYPEFILSLLAERDADKALIAEQAKTIDFLKEQLAQLANFNPDWDMLEAARDSLREHAALITEQNARIAELESAASCKFMPVGVMSQSKFENLDDGSVRFIALWPRPGVPVFRKRPEDGVLVYAKVAGITLVAEE